MIERWIPWKFLVKRIMRSYGFPDPFLFLAKLYRFSEPSEVQTPFELLRAGTLFHARGLINTKAIQNNLDWVWPFWVEKQFNPADPSFLPRAYSLTHINLTHRNWTAVGQPDLPLYPLVAPRGLVTPLYDGWSIDFWIYRKPEEWLIPSRCPQVDQLLEFDPELAVRTRSQSLGMELISRVWLENHASSPHLMIRVRARSEQPAYLAVCLRPYNPEGVQFIASIAYDAKSSTWLVNRKTSVQMSDAPEKILFSNYEHGDVIHRFTEDRPETGIECNVGMATSSALFRLKENLPREIQLRIPLDGELKGHSLPASRTRSTWQTVLKESARLQLPDARTVFLYEAAARTLVLLSAGDVVPGPYTYRRFWFRDACLMINALLSLGLKERVFRLLDSFLPRQERSGYFKSQEGEWDSNGQVLWIFDRYRQLTGEDLPRRWVAAVLRGARWIVRKRTPKGEEHGGLLPPGFSAEHLGPNDFYYWDDFWGLAGLKAAARIAAHARLPDQEQAFLREAADFERAIFDSIDQIPEQRRQGAIPASPHRRMDSGAVGSLAADYPLQLTPAGNAAVAKTVDFLMNRCFYGGGFFQDMIHSGINAYLTLSIAQTLLRNEDPRYRDLVGTVADLASPTGQWPEAIHPKTGGGCMGDGQHGWAAAEWVQIVRNGFVREEGDALVVGSGLFPRWMDFSAELTFGPTPTPFGDVAIRISAKDGRRSIKVDAAWRGEAPAVAIRVPGFRPMRMESFAEPLELEALPCP
ncbi:MAG: hypothetical protein LLG97_17110 [Deltaproteobacteria bacterium]|nr:hypothetical protein [Deltaproteobacteria bacterium]